MNSWRQVSMKNGFGLQSTTTFHELQSKFQLVFAFGLVGGSFFDVAWVNLCSSLFPVFLPSYSMQDSLQSCCWLSCCPTCRSAPQGRGSAPLPVHCSGNQNHFSGAWQGREIGMVSVIVSINSEVSKVSCCTNVTFLLLKGVSQRGQEPFWTQKKRGLCKSTS